MFKNFLRPIGIGLIVGALVTCLVLLVLSFSATTFDIPSAAVVPLATLANAMGAFFSGFTAAKLNKRNGWFIGLCTAMMLFLLTTVSGFGLYHTVDGSFLIVKALIMLACGMVGGIVALNSGKQKRH